VERDSNTVNLRSPSSVPPLSPPPALPAAEAAADDDNHGNKADHQRRTSVGRRGAVKEPDRRALRRHHVTPATERERTRARQLNDAFDRLRRVVPTSATHGQRRRLSKIAILRLAVNYLATLTTLLGQRLPAERFHDTGTGLVRTYHPPQI